MAQKNKLFKSLESILPEATEEQLDAIVGLIDKGSKEQAEEHNEEVSNLQNTYEISYRKTLQTIKIV